MEEQALLQAIERIVHTEVSDSEARLNKRIDKLETRMDSMDNRIESIEGKINVMQDDLQNLQIKVENGFHTIAAIIRDEVPAYPAKKYKKI